MSDEVFETYWPLQPGRDADLYFYLEAIEEYLPENRVRVVGRRSPARLGCRRVNRLGNYRTGTRPRAAVASQCGLLRQPTA